VFKKIENCIIHCYFSASRRIESVVACFDGDGDCEEDGCYEGGFIVAIVWCLVDVLGFLDWRDLDE